MGLTGKRGLCHDGWMKGIWGWWFVTAVFVALLVLGGFWLYQKDQAKKDAELAATLIIKSPAEAGVGGNQKSLYEYDTTDHKAMFVIRGVNTENKTMQLRYILPEKWRGNEITTK